MKLPMKLRTIGIACFLLAPALPLAAQPKPGETTYGSWEINLFGGGSYFKRQDPRPYFDLGRGGVAGFRITQNFWNYVGLEEAVTVHGTNNATFTKPGGFDTVSFGLRQRQVSVNPVFHFTPRDAAIRPFVTAGPGFNWYVPTDTARNQALQPNGNGLGYPVNLKTGFAPMFNYGAGLKAKLGQRVGLRVDARGYLTQSTTLGVAETANPVANQVTFTERSPLQSLQLTGGLTLYMGKLTEEPIGDFRAGSIESSAQTACPGDTLTLRVPVTNTMNGVTSKYKWNVGGQDQTAQDTLTYKVPNDAKPGPLNIRAVVDADTSTAPKNILKYVKKNPIAATARDTSVTVKEYKAPTVSASASPASIGPNDTATLTATPGLSDCSGDATYNWEVDGGTLSGSGASRTFTPSGLNLACGTTRTVNAKVTIRDSKGGEATATTPITVAAAACPPPPPPADLRSTQFDDILFTSGGNRVNNCGKRTLDRVYEQAMASGDYDILLVGHIDSSESKIKVRKGAKSIDRQRVENAAAYLIAGEQPCKRFDRSRVKVAIAGDAQGSPLRTSLCESSVKERSGSKISARDDKAKFRRVEVWLVPREGKGPLPAGITGIEPAPEVKGCPK